MDCRCRTRPGENVTTVSRVSANGTVRSAAAEGHLDRRLIFGRTVGVAEPPPWLRRAYAEFRRNVTDPAYPCFFGTKAENAGHLYYTYCESPTCPTLPDSIRHFLELKRGSVHFDTNLALFVAPESEPRPHEFYRDRLWEMLRHLHENDREPWPVGCMRDPDDPHWEFTFGGEQFFVFTASPSYTARRSRNLGACQVMMMQPRSSFVVVENEAHGIGARSIVRRRIAAWDDVGVHPDLGTYGHPEFREWKQYFLPNDMTPESGRCPFHHGLSDTSGTDAPPPKPPGRSPVEE
jgi:FPC/CPF motif-containing protein YcgG